MKRTTHEPPKGSLASARRFLAIVAVSLPLLLAGCATQPMDDGSAGGELERGRRAWLAGDYRAALPDLMTAAEAEQARAQYALGYMYYYGQGVEEDTEKGMAWIKRAAANGDQRAVEALSRLADTFSRPRREGGEPAPSGREDGREAPSPPAEPGNAADPAPQLEEPASSDAPAASGETDPVKAGAAWLEGRAPGHFTIQLLAARDLDTVDRYLDQSSLPEPAHIVATEQDNGRWLLVLMGDYPDRATVQRAVGRLPDTVKETGTWPRRFEALQR